MNFNDQIISETFIANRKQFYIKVALLDLHAPMIANSLTIQKQFDYQLGHSFALLADMATGETTEESETKEFTYDFQVFETWWDHLKYRITKKRYYSWLIRWVIFPLKINYTIITKKYKHKYPVRVLRACPHIESTFEQSPTLHLKYLYPLTFRENL